MTEFLQTVARHYFRALPRLENGQLDSLQFTDWLFVFPSRRAGLFFGKYLCDLNGEKPLLSPGRITIGDLFSLFSDYRVADRTELLFRLYKVYNEVRREREPLANVERFENFIFWGEMMLRDFDEVDKYLIPADRLFHNVRDLKELDEFMDWDEETLAIFRTFWANVAPQNTATGSAKESFTRTWAILYEVYARFKQELRREKMAYEGMRQRDVVERLAFDDMEKRLMSLPRHIVLVGITAINRAERELLLWLKNRGVLECCWDYADPQVQDIAFVKENLRDFGNALSADECCEGIVPIGQKHLVRMAVPSGVGQTSEAAKVLKQWGNRDAIHTAVVLPDEHLLDSMLYQLPAEFETYNVTMGYSLKSTPVTTLVEALIFLQSNIRRDAQSGTTFYYKAVLPLLSHAFLLDLALDQCAQLRTEINRKSLYQVPESMLQANEMLRLIFRQGDPIGYLRAILQYFLGRFQPEEPAEDEVLANGASAEKTDRHVLNRECLIAYLQVLDQLEAELQAAGMTTMDHASLYHLIRKMAQGLSVSFSGEPLMGLQVMGVLETRAIDFERIVILSMNEGVVPSKPSQNSFIPNTLRQAFSLPTQIYKDLVYAYHFYRLISRASEVVFLYDSRVDGVKSTGEQSRYLLQLEYLTDAKIEERAPLNRIVSQGESAIAVPKDASVMAQLEQFKVGGQCKFSATSLKTYITCPLQFYLANVRHLTTDDEMDDELDDSKFGTILHDTLKTFYSRFEGQMVLADVLRKAIGDPKIILDYVRAEYEKQFNCAPDNGYQQLVCSMIAENVKSVLKHDMEQTPFFYLAGEFECELDYQVNKSLSVRLKAIYDRLDIGHNPDGTTSLRIVDYKTGSPKANSQSKIDIGDIDKIFAADSKCSKEAFQLLFYCLTLKYIGEESKQRMNLLPKTERNCYNRLEPHLYFTRTFMNENVESKTQILLDFEPHRDSIEQQTKALF
ncbi:MAG: PD-(D/E)XK nuclease family protein, partial [Bacteroidales bacterium]|nr:PD-(D/E)XK nuclease family protein [Bacteroidales bacterium]